MQGLGGALRLFVAVLWLADSQLVGNAAQTIAGALFFNQSCAQASGYGSTSGYNFGLDVDSAAITLSPGQQQQAVATQSKDCSTLLLANVTMMSNSAEGAGGAIYVTSPEGLYTFCGVTKLQDQIGVVNQARTTNQSALCPSWLDGYNTASGYGSVVAYPASRLILTCNSSISASYTCTDSTSSEPESSALIMDGGVDVQNFWSTSAVNGSTGQPLATLLLNAQLLDMLGQIMPVDFPAGLTPRFEVNTPAGNSSSVFGQLSADASMSGDGLGRFSGLLVRAKPGDVNFSFSSSAHPELGSAPAAVHIRDCVPGEVQGQNGDVCDQCGATQYSFGTSSPVCNSPCPNNAECPGGSILYPALGYWHSDAASTIVHACPNQDACRGNRTILQNCQAALTGTFNASADPTASVCPSNGGANASSAAYTDMQCSTGYEGRLCSICQQGHGLSGRFKCDRCQDTQLAAFEYFLVLVAAVLLNIFLIWRLLQEDVAKWNLVEGADYVEVLLTYVQLASLLGLLDIEWPSVMGGLFKAAAWISQVSPQNVSVSCILSAHSRGLPISVSLILLQIFIPFAVLSALSIAWLAAFFWHGFRSGNFSAAWLSKRLELTAYSVLGYYYPSLTQASLSVFSCLTIDHPIPSNTPYAYAAQASWPSGYWIPDMRHKCFVGWHLRLTLGLGLPTLLLLSLAIPVAFALSLGRKQRHLGTRTCKEQHGYAYRSYRIGCWWERSAFQLKLLALLLVVVNGKPLGNYLQTLMVLCLFIVELLYQVFVHPYRFPGVQVMQTTVVAVVVFSTVASLFLQNYGNNASKGGLGVVGIGMGVVNVVFFAYILYCTCWAYLRGFRHRVGHKVSTAYVQLTHLPSRNRMRP